MTSRACRRRAASGSGSSGTTEPEGDALDAFDQVVHRFGRSVGEVAVVPGGDLQSPALERAAQRANLRGSDLVREICSQFIEPSERQFLVLVAVELADRFFGVPGCAHVAVRVTGLEQVQQLGLSVFAQTFFGLGEEASDSVEGIVFVSAMAERLVLDPPPRLVELGRGQFHYMEGVGDERDLGELGGEDRFVGRGQVERAVGDGGPPGRRPSLKPVLGTFAASALHEVQQLSLADVDDRGDEVGAVVGGETDEAGLIQPQGSDRAEAVRVLDERFAIRAHGLVDGVPVALQRVGHIVDAAAGFADCPGGPTAGPIGDVHPGSSNPAVLFSPGLLRTITVDAPPSALVPEERGGDPIDGQVAVLHDHPLLHLSTHAALWATRRGGRCLYVDLEH